LDELVRPRKPIGQPYPALAEDTIPSSVRWLPGWPIAVHDGG